MAAIQTDKGKTTVMSRSEALAYRASGLGWLIQGGNDSLVSLFSAQWLQKITLSSGKNIAQLNAKTSNWRGKGHQRFPGARQATRPDRFTDSGGRNGEFNLFIQSGQ